MVYRLSMTISNTIDLKAAALRFRENQRNDSSVSCEDGFDAQDDVQASEQSSEKMSVEESPPPPPAQATYIYSSKDVKVTLSYIEIDNFTYSIRSICSIKRIEVKPPKQECWISIGFVLIAAVTLFTYLLIGALGVSALSLSFLSITLVVLFLLSVLCQELKSSFTLELYNFEGKLIDKICVLSKKSVSALEKALKEGMRNTA